MPAIGSPDNAMISHNELVRIAVSYPGPKDNRPMAMHSVKSPYRGPIENPARLSPSVGSLFRSGALAAELRAPGDPSLLLPAEAQALSKAVLKRVQEFAAGRLCARALLAEFGIHDFPIKVADDRQPVWPETLVGSITHTAGLCAAVVAPRSVLRAV